MMSNALAATRWVYWARRRISSHLSSGTGRNTINSKLYAQLGQGISKASSEKSKPLNGMSCLGTMSGSSGLRLMKAASNNGVMIWLVKSNCHFFEDRVAQNSQWPEFSRSVWSFRQDHLYFHILKGLEQWLYSIAFLASVKIIDHHFQLFGWLSNLELLLLVAKDRVLYTAQLLFYSSFAFFEFLWKSRDISCLIAK